MLFLRIFKHLLPRGRAFSLTVDRYLRQFFEGLTPFLDDLKEFADLAYLDLLPEHTRELDAWESQFGIKDKTLTESQRRTRLAAYWKALGGQDPAYLQAALRDAGFDVYVHDWYTASSSGTPPYCRIPRNPTLVLVDELEEGVASGYILNNKRKTTRTAIIPQAGEPETLCGEPEALCGNFLVFEDVDKAYPIPVDSSKWPYIVYVGGETFPELAVVDEARRDEFEELILTLFPAHLWVGVLAFYGSGGELDLSSAVYRTSLSAGGATAVGGNLDLSDAVYSTNLGPGGVASEGSELDLSTATYSTNLGVGGTASAGSELDLSTATYNSGS